MSDITTIVNDYIAGWNEGDAGRRRALVAQAYTEDARYVDPMMSGEGHDGIAAMIGGAREQFPGHRFVLADGPDAHHNRVRFTWHLVAEGGDGAAPAAIGVDFARVAGDGRLAEVTGFLEPAASS